MTSLDSTSKSNNSPDVPEAYALGTVPFLGCTIYLDSRPLIPRSETEWWVEKAIATMSESVAVRGAPQAGSRGLNVLDLFAGSGCIGIAILKHIPNSQVTFGESEARHIPTIQKNILMNNIDPTRARVVQTDVYSDLRNHYDYILANPPYLSKARLQRIEQSVLEHEPPEALFAEDDGFALIDETLRGLLTRLLPGGQAWIEHEPEHEPRIAVRTTELGLVATTHRDQYGIMRYSGILFP